MTWSWLLAALGLGRARAASVPSVPVRVGVRARRAGGGAKTVGFLRPMADLAADRGRPEPAKLVGGCLFERLFAAARRHGPGRRSAAIVRGPLAARAVRPDPMPAILAARSDLVALFELFRPGFLPNALGETTVIAELVDWLREPSWRKAERGLRRFRRRLATPAQVRFGTLLEAARLGREPRARPWGVEPGADALRVRFVRRGPKAAEAAEMCWLGALWWAGARILEDGLAEEAPERVRPFVAAAVAASAGARTAAELLLRWFPRGAPDEGAARRWAAPLVLRAVVEEGWLVPEAVPFLVPKARPGSEPRWWLPFAAAFRAAVEARGVGPCVFLLAAALAMAYEEGTEEDDGGVFFEDDTDEEDPVGFVRSTRLDTGAPDPWRTPAVERFQGLLGVDLAFVEERLADALGILDPVELSLLYEDRPLLHAALFAALGGAASARVHLATSRSGYARWLGGKIRRAAERARPELLWPLLDGSFAMGDRRVGWLLHTPDPSVALGTPVWALEEGLGAIAPFAMRRGKAKELRTVMDLLRRRDLVAELEPFWLLRRGDVAAGVRGLRWAAGFAPEPSDEEALAFLERLAKEALGS